MEQNQKPIRDYLISLNDDRVFVMRGRLIGYFDGAFYRKDFISADDSLIKFPPECAAKFRPIPAYMIHWHPKLIRDGLDALDQQLPVPWRFRWPPSLTESISAGLIAETYDAKKAASLIVKEASKAKNRLNYNAPVRGKTTSRPHCFLVMDSETRIFDPAPIFPKLRRIPWQPSDDRSRRDQYLDYQHAGCDLSGLAIPDECVVIEGHVLRETPLCYPGWGGFLRDVFEREEIYA